MKYISNHEIWIVLNVKPLVTAGIGRTAVNRVGIASGSSEVLWTSRWGRAQARHAHLAVPVP